MNKEIKMPKWLETLISIIVVTLVAWLSYYPIWLVNKIGLLLRGPMMFVKNPESSFDLWINNVSSLGFLLFTVALVFIFNQVCEDNEDE